MDERNRLGGRKAPWYSFPFSPPFFFPPPSFPTIGCVSTEVVIAHG